MKFFTPTAKFVSWLDAYAGSLPIIDLGCGEGVLIKKLAAKRKKVLGIDPYNTPDFPCNYFLQQFAQESSVVIRTPAVLTICRPDHSGWVEQVINVANAASRILYVGLERNLMVDFESHVPVKIDLDFRIGKEGEHVYAVDR